MEINTIVCADALDFLRTLPDASVGAFVTSPPYNLSNTEKGWGGGNAWKSAAIKNGYQSFDDNMTDDEYVCWQRECMTEMVRALSNDGVIFYNHKWRIQGGFIQRLADDITRGFPVRQIIIWDRGSGFNFNPRFFCPTYEVLYMICKPDFNIVGGNQTLGDVWNILPEQNNPHPAPFPVELAERCIRSTTAKLICDPFMGSGTTAIAARNLGRDFIGCDKSAAYVAIAEDRLRLPFAPRSATREADLSDLPMFAQEAQS